MAVLLAFGLAASVTACGDVNTGEDKKEAATIGTTVESENVTGVSDTTEIQNAEEEYKSGCIESFDYNEYFRFLYKGIIIKHNKTEPTYTKTSLFLCEKRRFFMARTEKGVVATI